MMCGQYRSSYTHHNASDALSSFRSQHLNPIPGFQTRALRLVNHDLSLLLRMCWLIFHLSIGLALGGRLAILTLLRIC